MNSEDEKESIDDSTSEKHVDEDENDNPIETIETNDDLLDENTEETGNNEDMDLTVSSNQFDSQVSSRKLKKPLTSYIIYCGEQRNILKEQFPGLSFKETAAKFSEGFRSLSESERERLNALALADKDRYKSELASQSVSYSALNDVVFTQNESLVIPLV